MANSNTSELQVTQLKAPTLALKFITTRFKNINITQLEEEYGLSRKTLYRILDENDLPRCSHKYMHVFVRIISAKRRFAQLNGNTDLVKDIDLLLRDLILVQHDVPTDDEILHFGQKA